MVDWKSPLVIAYQAEILIRFVHILAGIYLWEFIVTFPFEWSIYTGKRPFRWSIGIYIACRWLTIVALALFLAIFDIQTEVNCGAAIKSVTTIAHIAIGLTSVLLMLRAIAINGGKKIITIPLIVILLANWGTLLHGIYVADAVWVPSAASCSITNAATARLNVWVSFTCDLIFLVVSVAGLLRKEGVGRLWRLLLRQGLIWMLASAVGYLLPAVFLAIDLNDAMDYMFEPFAVIVMTICASRMYQGLVDYLVPTTNSVNVDLMDRSANSSATRRSKRGNRSNTVPVAIEMETVTDSPSGPTLYLKTSMDISEGNSVTEPKWTDKDPTSRV
ncbi:hypothetical protein OE88DRAFT_1651876 [Heliocybe sulcata]|uniref:Uncharacterized protein n=1 Tax=Heliocybe sulcata TaxID=5364 RepID=A0A5C3NPC6_9AGAM|nr:hypothetical protein OE88DRAFT_1651876 [Heliocybe sulcata]